MAKKPIKKKAAKKAVKKVAKKAVKPLTKKEQRIVDILKDALSQVKLKAYNT